MVDDKYFVYNGKKSSDFDVWTPSLEGLSTPQKRYTEIEVQGRNGNLIIEDGTFMNQKLTLKDCFTYQNVSENIKGLTSFLNRQKGYQRLELSWLPDEYRMAQFVGGINTTIGDWERFGKFDLSFNCKPQRFLKSGEEPTIIIPPIAGMRATPYFVYPTTFPGYVMPANRWTIAVTVLDAPFSVSFKARYFCIDAGEEFTSDSETYTPAVGERVEILLDNSLGTVKKWSVVFDYGNGRTTEEIDSMRIRVEGYAVVGDDEFMYIDGICARSFSIMNPTGFTCNPIFDVYGSIFGLQDVIKADGEHWNIVNWNYSGTANKMIVDCENEYVYSEINGVKTNLTQYMELSHYDGNGDPLPLSFPNFGEGETVLYQYLTINNDNTYYVLYPHWYTI